MYLGTVCLWKQHTNVLRAHLSMENHPRSDRWSDSTFLLSTGYGPMDSIGRSMSKIIIFFKRGRFPKSYSSSASRTKLDSGEWIADFYPNINGILSNKDKMRHSLLKRIYCNSESEADELINNLDSKYRQYLDMLSKYQVIDKTYKDVVTCNKEEHSGYSRLEFLELKESWKNAKSDMLKAEQNIRSLTLSLPNFLADISPSTVKQNYNSIADNQIANCAAKSDLRTSLPFCLEYLTKGSAILDLVLTDRAATFLNDNSFTEVTVPNFIRQEVINKLGLYQIAEEMYSLQSKSELHRDVDSIRAAALDRKPKPEDDYIFKACGLSDITLMLMFLRQQTSLPQFPINYFSIGNQYRTPYLEKPRQSRLAVFLTATADEQSAFDAFQRNITMALQFWDNLNIAVKFCTVAPHLLCQHELAAVEVLADKRDRFLLSRLSISSDYISRRIMAYTYVKNDEFVHFTSGDLIDINTFINYIQK